MSKDHSKMKFPDSLIENFEMINSLDQEKLEEILKAFKEHDLELSCSSFAEDLQKNHAIDEEIGHEIYHFIITMSDNLRTFEKSGVKFLEQLNQFAIKKSENETKYDSSKVMNFINKTAKNQIIKITSKSYEVISCNAKNYMSNSAKIITDIRPILIDENENDFKKELQYATILHNLKLQYNKGGGRENYEKIHITLNSEDLYELRDVIHRAIEKDTFFKDYLVEKEIKYLD